MLECLYAHVALSICTSSIITLRCILIWLHDYMYIICYGNTWIIMNHQAVPPCSCLSVLWLRTPLLWCKHTRAVLVFAADISPCNTPEYWSLISHTSTYNLTMIRIFYIIIYMYNDNAYIHMYIYIYILLFIYYYEYITMNILLLIYYSRYTYNIYIQHISRDWYSQWGLGDLELGDWDAPALVVVQPWKGVEDRTVQTRTVRKPVGNP